MAYYSASWLRFGMILAFLLSHLACRLSSSEHGLRTIRGHTEEKGEVWHGMALLHAERYCSYCHGLGLVGGQGFEPSCYSCHGKNWRDESGAASFAPVSHTQQLAGWHHEPQLHTPQGVCNECHGAELTGDPVLGTPSCLLCHEALWED